MLTEIMKDNLVIAELKAKDKEGVIKEVASMLVEAGVVKDESKFVEDLKAREKVESTAIGDGIAIPHARSDTVEGLTVAFARSSEGIDFESMDGKPVHLIFMIACNSDIAKEYLQVLARIARLCKNDKMRGGLVKARDGKEIIGLIKSFDLGSGKLEKIRLQEGRTVYPNQTEDRRI